MAPLHLPAFVNDAFRAGLVALLPRLRRFALGLTADHSQADALIEAACEAALARREQWQPGTRLDNWTLKILHNLWIDQLRARRPRAATPEPEPVPPDRDEADRIEARRSLEDVLRAMQGLPPQMREVLACVCIEGQSYQHAADLLGIPIGTVMGSLARARLALMRELAPPAAMPEPTRAGVH